MSANQANTEKAPFIPKNSPNSKSRIGQTIAVISGKGGVGKSFTSAYLAVSLQRLGYSVGILDADITGPSIPFAFNVHEPVKGDGTYFYPVKSRTGIQIISSNLLLAHPDDPIVWRGPMISTLIEQFYTEVVWDVDFLIIDMPPGTSDVSLTVFQKIKISDAVIVASPQSLVSMVVEKSAKMAELLSVPLLSLVENMAYVSCPKCHEKIELFGPSHPELASKHGIPIFDQIPFDKMIAEHMDNGKIEDLKTDYLKSTVEAIVSYSKMSDNLKNG